MKVKTNFNHMEGLALNIDFIQIPKKTTLKRIKIVKYKKSQKLKKMMNLV